ncbi:putative PEP-binding protein [Leptolyngbya iicbica]|uniref:Pyruvate, water dikinase n=2 Tax=Cyanophyceae TaxID=3028117 RepID=A0A4Q7E7N0_9CYAN|nr:putative PEP-binding protein [Leptolyngbya sp. LK]RZM78582.1 hypothetical protein DYY88_07160 [Leptolyngbya sp. LK]
MSCFLPITPTTDVQAPQVGESASLLQRAQQAGHAVPPSWVIPAAYFHQTLQKLEAREPLLTDWPQLLWQTTEPTGYAVQQVAKRLRQPLLNLPLDLSWAELLAAINTPAVRLLPSLWLGEQVATVPWGQMLAAPVCWADPEALEAALKQVWLSALDAKSLTFWRFWRATQADTEAHYPAMVNLAVIVQAVEPATFSGTLTVRPATIAIAAVEGLPQALAECCPATFSGKLPQLPHFPWQVGFQETFYRPPNRPDDNVPALIESGLTKVERSRLQLTVPDPVEQPLWSLAQELTQWSEQPLHLEWLQHAESGTLQISQLYAWPLQPYEAQTTLSKSDSSEALAGRGAAPGTAQGHALILAPDQPAPMSAHRQIIIASEIAPDQLPLLKTASGVVAERGGLTCHAAVLARELGLPAIVGLSHATTRLQPGEAIEIDGDRGLITRLPNLPSVPPAPALPTVELAPTQTEIWVNLSQPEIAVAIAALPVTGVGLLRSEWLMMPVLERQHPYHWLATGQKELLLKRLEQQLRPILEAFHPRPVRYRSLDIRTSEFAQLAGAPAVEPNPMLGVRGAFSYHHHPQFFGLELTLLKRLQDQGYDNLQLILPFVRTVEEVQYCQTAIAAMGLHQQPDFALWMMAEVPSVLFQLPQYVAAGIQGIAIGTHDLTQLLLGIDRDQTVFTAPYDETHPAVQQAIAQLIHTAQQAGISCCLCGSSPTHHPEFVAAAVRQQVTGLSVDVSALALAAQIVQQAETNR